jgi:hypothetical protein
MSVDAAAILLTETAIDREAASRKTGMTSVLRIPSASL